MPHIIAEYTETLNIDVPKLLSALHDALAEQDTITIEAIKTRAVPVQYTLVGDGHQHDLMIHITLKLLPGRDDALKAEMTQGLYEVARKHAHNENISIIVEAAELHEPSYIK